MIHMSKMSDSIIKEEEAEIVNHHTSRVLMCGGNAMSGGLMAILESLDDTQLNLKDAEDELTAALEIADVSDRELDRNGIVQVMPTVLEPALIAPVMPVNYMKSGLRYTLIMNGACTNCAHCGMTLTDPTSQEAGLGPQCRKRGYNDDPVSLENTDAMQAFIDLVEYPVLVEFLTANYKDKGKHKLMVGLVKVASLNRRTPVHDAITDAIDSLGYKRLASTLRESMSVIEIKDHDANNYNVWVKKSVWNYQWSRDIKYEIPNAYSSRQFKGMIVPKSAKKPLWALMLKHYSEYILTIRNADGSKKSVKIRKMTAPNHGTELPGSST